MISALLLATLQASPAVQPGPAAEGAIIVTASLAPVPEDEAPLSVTLFSEETIAALGFAMASDLIRLSPGVSVSTAGAQGTETVVRIRGAESNHSLVFIDGIAFNDIAAANAARFDTFTAGALGRLELIRGPQSALWGSEALGGVVAMSSPGPLGAPGAEALIEGGSRESRRAEAAASSGGERAGLSATFSWIGSDGIDIIGGGAGDQDGFENMTFSLKGMARLGPFEIGAVGRHIGHEIEFDGVDPLTFQRADTLDSSSSETLGVRGWIGFGRDDGWSGRIEAQHLDSENRNRVGRVRTSNSFGRRTRYGGRVARHLAFGASRHDLIAAIEREEESFGLRNSAGGAGDRDLARARTAIVGEWRANWSEALVTDLAVRHDDFNRFADATTFRANALLNVGGGFTLTAGYGEGIAQPSFTDLFGFPGFPFRGNPDLRPEHSRGFEAGMRWRGRALRLEAVAFSNDLQDEIVEDFSVFPGTVINAPGESRRRGLEVSGDWQPVPPLRIGANYTYLESSQESVSGGAAMREIRRPRHSANFHADWRSGPLTAGGSIAYVGARIDRDFDLFPAPVVALDDYLLASLRIAWRISRSVELHGRIENAGDADYQDVVGYNTPGRAVHAGLRFLLGR